MSSSDHSTLSLEKTQPLINQSSNRGTHKVKYQPDSDWDFHLDAGVHPIDMSLMLPHYRARHQPIDHRMSMFVANDDEPIKLKVCRNFPRSKFYLEVIADTSDVTVYLPSDFKGSIHLSSTKSTKFSSGFVNRILRNARLNQKSSTATATGFRLTQLHDDDESTESEGTNEDEVLVNTRGKVTFKMWDIQTCSVENAGKEGLKRLFGCTRQAPETPIDWDCLLKD
ncbi:hypothetical protein BJ165DRAFT_10505 [Panaeolus papilionaceus]|nr:hypothetical protein BJ165DRAFT_10505 [Panaeolus papilionaceus]